MKKVGAVTSRRQPDLTLDPEAGAAFSVRDKKTAARRDLAGFALAMNRR